MDTLHSNANSHETAEAERPRPRSHLLLRLVTLVLYVLPLVLVVLYVSASTSPPNRHTDLIFTPPVAADATIRPVRDYQQGSVTSHLPFSIDTSRSAAYLYNTHLSPAQSWHQVERAVRDLVDGLGGVLVSLLGLDDHDATSPATGADGEIEEGETLFETGGLTSWSESSVFVEATQALYASRPSSFGPHILLEPLESRLYPINAFSTADSYGCESNSSHTSPLPTPPRQGWIAIVQRGHCPFSHKVRYAQERGAVGVVFGDQSVEEGGVAGVGGLLTPWSPDDTSDIRIPSAFVSRASYLSLLRTWLDEQNPKSKEPVGLVVVLSKDELFAWPLLDLLLLILFLPSLLTLITVFSQRIRLIRQQQLDRAPRDAVARLPVFSWGEDSVEKHIEVPTTARPEDEEQRVGTPPATETTPLLTTVVVPARTPFFARLFTRSYSRSAPVVLAPARPQFRPSSSECAICLCDFEKGEMVMQLPCGHLFHRQEIEGWLLDSKRHCPICRASITLDDPSSPDPHHPLPPPPAPAQVPTLAHSAAAATPTAIPSHVARDGLAPPAAASPVASSSSVTLDSAVRRAGDDV